MKYSEKDQELIKKIDRTIAELVYEKVKLIKAYNYYHGKRDPEQFRHLEENYGIGTPTSVEFVPLVRKHVDVLVGEYLTIPVRPKISCKDKKTLAKINQEKLDKINEAIVERMKQHLRDVLNGNATHGDKRLLADLNDLQETMEANFISEYEIASQNIVDWSMQSRNIDFTNKRKTILTDLLVTGTCYYRTLESPSKASVDLIVLNPLHTFLDRNFESQYSKYSQRAVIREYLTKNEILQKYGDLLKEEDIESLDGQFPQEMGTNYVRGFETVSGIIDHETDGILGGYEMTPVLNFTQGFQLRRHPVYDVEWLQVDKEDKGYITNRYRGIRIGHDIYVLIGKVENVHRSVDRPKECTLSINGTFYSDRNGDPFSLILSTASLQDKYDILCFYRDNMISESGSKGDWVDVAYLPTFLGSDVTERLMKWKAYKKQSLALIDSSQEGNPPMNTTFGGYDDSISLQAIQAIDLAIMRVEETCSTITGVFREKLGGIEQRDAVTNVQVGIRQSTYITKQYYYLMDLMTKEILLDILDTCKYTFKKGITGSLVLGDKLNKIFTALPEHYTTTDHDIHIVDTSEMLQDFETIKQLGFEFSKNSNIDPEIVLDVITSKSLTKLKEDMKVAIRKRRDEMDQTAELQQQVEQTGTQLQQLSAENEKLQKEIQRLNQEKIDLEKTKLEKNSEIEWYKARNQKEYNDRLVDLKEKHIQAEVLELYDSNPRNDEIKNT